MEKDIEIIHLEKHRKSALREKQSGNFAVNKGMTGFGTVGIEHSHCHWVRNSNYRSYK